MRNFSKIYQLLMSAFILVSSLSVILVFNSGSWENPSGETNSTRENTTNISTEYIENPINEALPIITIDAGHGGYDPGKVAPDGTEEKDVNLQIALYLKEALTSKGFKVYLTRDTDISLYEEGASSKKVSDLNHRISIANENKSDLFISIHQNSFSDSSVHGAQVFYYDGSNDGKNIAEAIQSSIRSTVDETNERKVKANSEYMLLKYSTCTALIVECGFLSNPDECAMLSSSDYQQLIANAIAEGILSSLK